MCVDCFEVAMPVVYRRYAGGSDLFFLYTFSAARGRREVNGGCCRRICRTVERAAREGGIGWVRGMEIGVSGDRPEAGEAGQLDGPVPRGGMTRGPVRKIVEAREVENLPRLWRWMGWNVRRGGMDRWNGGF